MPESRCAARHSPIIQEPSSTIEDENVASCFRHARDFRELEMCQLQMRFEVFVATIDHRVSEQLEPAEME